MEKRTADEVDSRVIKFFEVFDQTQLEQIGKQQLELNVLKAHNKQVLNKQAYQFTECSELENLFIDAVDVCRREVIKRQSEYVGSTQQISALKDMGLSGQMLMDGVCIRKDDLIFMFEQIFGNQKLKKEIPRSLRSQQIAI